MTSEVISAEDRYERQHLAVRDAEMAYVEVGEGDPVVFLHGNPTSSYLWRNIIPHVEPVARCLAPDLIGMGESSKIPGSMYRYVDHREYLDAWFDAMDLNNVVLVVHDWGSVLGFDWARRNEERIRGLAHLEAIISGYSWDDFDDSNRDIFRALRSPAGDQMVLEENFFVDKFLPALVLRELTAAEMEAYRRPYLEPGEARRPTLTWPREIPVDSDPPDVADVIAKNLAWLLKTEIPKLFLHAEPGVIVRDHPLGLIQMFLEQEEVTIKGHHFAQEDSPHEIGEAVAAFVKRLRG